MKKVLRKTDYYSLESVNERIEHYEKVVETLSKDPKKHQCFVINQKLLLFWVNYKSKNYKDGDKEQKG